MNVQLVPHLVVLGLLTYCAAVLQQRCVAGDEGRPWRLALSGTCMLVLAEFLYFIKLGFPELDPRYAVHSATGFAETGMHVLALVAAFCGLALLVMSLHRSGSRFRERAEAPAHSAGEPTQPLVAVERASDDSERIRRAESEANDAARAKAEFMRNLNYELRTPLTSVLGLATLLATDTSASDRKLHLQALQQSSFELMKFVEEVLEFIDRDSEAFELDPVRFSLRARLQHCFSEISKSADQAGVQASLSIDSDVPDRFRADHMRLTKVLSLLAAELLRHSDIGASLELEVHDESLLPEESTAEDAVLAFVIRGCGLRLAPEQVEKLEEEAEQGRDEHRTPTSPIARVSRVISLFGGELDVVAPRMFGDSQTSSLPVTELEFRFIAQLARYDLPERRPDSADSPIAGSGQAPLALRVLLVEDNMLNQVVAERLLARLGCTIETAEDGSKAIELFSASQFDVVLLDCELPGIDGYQVAAVLRKMEEGLDRRTPIIAVTAHTSDQQRRRCVEAGMDQFMAKPIDMGLLVSSLRAIDELGSDLPGSKRRYPTFFIETKDKPMC